MHALREVLYAKNCCNQTPLHCASQHCKKLGMVKIILQYTKELTLEEAHAIIDARDEQSNTALDLAKKNKTVDPKIIKALKNA